MNRIEGKTGQGRPVALNRTSARRKYSVELNAKAVETLSGVRLPLGASYKDGNWFFNVWAPIPDSLVLSLPEEQLKLPMTKCEEGYHIARFHSDAVRIRYAIELPDGTIIPDPASRYQPEGVHGPSEAFRSEFGWRDAAWFGLPLRDYIIYELHIGTFTSEGTLFSAAKELPRLKELGITAIEIMPLAQFPGDRNWGYDGVDLFAVQNSYGGPDGLKEFVDAAHALGLAVILDVVYNHFGPEGNYLGQLGYYFTDAYRTPWGRAINYDHAHSHHVRRFFIENALHWQTDFHIDALRLDAVHAIYDQSARPFLRELAEAVERRSEKLGRRFHLIAESDLNAARFVLPRSLGGYGLSAQWADDFHHSLHVLLTGETEGYYSSYTGGLEQFAKAWREGFCFTGEVASGRRAHYGEPTHLLSFRQFVVCAQNHDQVGNRMLGDRLSALAAFEKLKLAAACVLLSPFIPLIFMGEEYGEEAPFQYFASHSDDSLIDAVRTGRKKEFAEFYTKGEAPDPFDLGTFQNCKLRSAVRKNQRALLAWHQELIRLRKTYPCFTNAERDRMEVNASGPILQVHYHEEELLLFFNFSPDEVHPPTSPDHAERILSSADPRFCAKAENSAIGVLPPWSAAVYRLTQR